MLVVILFAGLVVYLSLFKDTYTDDAFIQLTYARSLAHRGTWGLVEDRRANAATSPLNVMLTAAAALAGESVLDASRWVTAVELTAIAVLLTLISTRLFGDYYFAVFAFVALATNPLLLSTLGLESVLFTLWIVASLYCLVTGRCLMLAAALALLTLTRADGVLLAILALAWVPVTLRMRVRSAGLYVLALAPWHLFSWIHLGSFVPDTLIIKVGQHAWGPSMTFLAGPALYVRTYPLAAVASVVPACLGLVGVGHPRSTVRSVMTLLATYGVAHFVGYWLLGVPPYHWYYIHQVVPAVLIGSLGLASFSERRGAPDAGTRPAARWAAVVVPAIGLGAILATEGPRLQEAPIHTNQGSPSQYREAGLWMKDHLDPSSVVRIIGEIGTLAYYSERDLVNEFSDGGLVSTWVRNPERLDRSVIALALKFNFLWRRDPPVARSDYLLRHIPRNNEKDRGADIPPVQSWITHTRWTQRLGHEMVLLLSRNER